MSLAALLAGGLAGWLWWRSRPGDVPPVPVTVSADSTPTPVDSLVPAVDLPELDVSDTVVRELLDRLSEHPGWASWLITDDLVRRFVTSVVNVAAGDSPRGNLGFLAPPDSFRVRGSEAEVYVAPESYRRYDALTEVFVSLDAEGAARLYRELHPLFEEAHRELGLSSRTFDQSLALALGNLLAVEVPDADVQVVPYEAIYEYREPELEALSPAQKHILRLGPRNARRFQEKLRELSTAVGITPGAPPPMRR